LAALERAFETSMAVPFLLTVVMGVASAAYIVVESRNNRRDMALANKKLSRAIGLFNTVKVKCVNNTACIEYTYEKLGVESSMELEYIWGQYLKLKERERQYRSTTEKINQYNEILVGELKKYAIFDAEVWTYQPEALLDSKEMVEVRHRLNVRRQKLRDRIDYNNKTIERHTEELTRLQKEWPELSISFEEM
jgi:DNA repair ATPase RecN